MKADAQMASWDLFFMQIPCHWHQYTLTRYIPSSPICSLIFTRSEPPTIPTLTFCEKKSDFLGINPTPMTGIQYSSHALKKNDSTVSGSFYAVRLSVLLKTLIEYLLFHPTRRSVFSDECSFHQQLPVRTGFKARQAISRAILGYTHVPNKCNICFIPVLIP